MTYVILTAPEVRAVLDGSKTGHRMAMKRTPSNYSPPPNVHAPKHEAAYFDCYCGERKTDVNPRGMGEYWCWWTPDDRQGPDWIRCPLGAPGPRVWVRETWCEMVREHRVHKDAREFVYKASCDPGKNGDGERCRQDYIAAGYPYQWRSPVTMPRWASRLDLEITAARVIRVDGVWTWDVDWRRV